MTSQDAKDVCRFPAALNGEIRTRRCTPFSDFRYPYAFSPLTSKVTALNTRYISIQIIQHFNCKSFLFCPAADTYGTAYLPSHRLLFRRHLHEVLRLHCLHHILRSEVSEFAVLQIPPQTASSSSSISCDYVWLIFFLTHLNQQSQISS